jgi:hypothetical protein
VRELLTLLAAASVALVIGDASAKAAAPAPPPDVSAIAQYVETFPTGRGAQAVGFGKTHTKPLPRNVARAVTREGGPDAAALSTIATSSSYGAPQGSVAPTRIQRERPRRPVGAPIGGESVSASEILKTGSANNLALLLLMGASTALVAAGRFRRS